MATRFKTCRTCKAVKPIGQFYRNPSYADGRMSDCKDCARAYQREMYWLKREQRLARKRAYYYANWQREREKRRAYQQSPRGREVHREANRFYYLLRRRAEARA